MLGLGFRAKGLGFSDVGTGHRTLIIVMRMMFPSLLLDVTNYNTGSFPEQAVSPCLPYFHRMFLVHVSDLAIKPYNQTPKHETQL